jgi:hypothetical protein
MSTHLRRVEHIYHQWGSNALPTHGQRGRANLVRPAGLAVCYAPHTVQKDLRHETREISRERLNACRSSLRQDETTARERCSTRLSGSEWVSTEGIVDKVCLPLSLSPLVPSPSRSLHVSMSRSIGDYLRPLALAVCARCTSGPIGVAPTKDFVSSRAAVHHHPPGNILEKNEPNTRQTHGSPRHFANAHRYRDLDF